MDGPRGRDPPANRDTTLHRLIDRRRPNLDAVPVIIQDEVLTPNDALLIRKDSRAGPDSVAAGARCRVCDLLVHRRGDAAQLRDAALMLVALPGR